MKISSNFQYIVIKSSNIYSESEYIAQMRLKWSYAGAINF